MHRTIFSDIDVIKGNNSIQLAIGEISSLWELIKLSFLSKDRVYNEEGVFFKVPMRRKQQKPILFGRFKTEPRACRLSEAEEECLNFYKPNSKIVHIMKEMGYNLKKKLGLTFEKGVRT